MYIYEVNYRIISLSLNIKLKDINHLLNKVYNGIYNKIYMTKVLAKVFNVAAEFKYSMLLIIDE